MKIEITKEAKRWLTVAEMPEVRQLQADFKDEKINEIATTLAYIVIHEGSLYELISAKAEIAGNGRIHGYYNETSGCLDIWIEAKFTAFVYEKKNDKSVSKFFIAGAYLSDIWKADGTDETREEILSHAYIREFIEKE